MKRKDELLKAFPNGKEFIVRFNFDFSQKRYEKFNTVDLALKSNMLKLNEIAQTFNNETPMLMIQAWLVTLSIFMNFDITTQQAKITSRLIYDEIHFFNLAEITLLFKRILKGQYGQFYGKFNGQTILLACSDFKKERGHVLSRLNEDQQATLGYIAPHLIKQVIENE